MRRRTLALYSVLCWAFGAEAQSYPGRPITLVVPQPPGGAIDSLARGLGEELSKRLGVPVVVDNKPGASGMIGTSAVAHANADGYTLLLTNHTPVLAAPFVFSKVPYDVKKDLTFISAIGSGQFVLAVNSDVPARTMTEFVDWARRTRGTVSYGSLGIGTYSHLAGSYLTQSRDLDMTHVPFKGEAPLLQELLAGRIAWGVTTLAPLLPHIQSGRLRALAVIADRRMKEIPSVPTMPEAGMNDPELKPLGWIGLLGPGSLPVPIVQRLERETREAIRTPAMQARLDAAGTEPIGSTADEFRKEFDASLPVMEKLVKISGAKLD